MVYVGLMVYVYVYCMSVLYISQGRLVNFFSQIMLICDLAHSSVRKASWGIQFLVSACPYLLDQHDCSSRQGCNIQHHNVDKTLKNVPESCVVMFRKYGKKIDRTVSWNIHKLNRLCSASDQDPSLSCACLDFHLRGVIIIKLAHIMSLVNYDPMISKS